MPTTNSQALLSSTTGAMTWGTNFGANNILTTGTIGGGAITGTTVTATGLGMFGGTNDEVQCIVKGVDSLFGMQMANLMEWQDAYGGLYGYIDGFGGSLVWNYGISASLSGDVYGTVYGNAYGTLYGGAPYDYVWSGLDVTNIVGYWSFNNNTLESTILDYSLNGYNGTFANSSFVQGRLGKAANCDGNYTDITISDAAPLRMTTGGTIFAWIYPYSIGENSEGRIVDRSNADTTSGGYALYLGATNTLRFRVNAGTATISSNNAVTLNAWNFVAITFDGTGRQLWVNGVNVTSTGGAETGLPPNTVPPTGIHIANTATNLRTFYGLIDEVGMFSRKLTQAEMISYMQNTTPLGGISTLMSDKLMFTQVDGNEYIDSLTDGELDLAATTSINGIINGTEQIQLFDGKFAPTTTNDIDLGDSTHLWKDTWTIGKQYFRDSAIYAWSGSDGWLNLVADTGVEFNTPIVNVADLYVAGNFDFGSDSTDIMTMTGRFVPRTTASDPQDATPGNRPAGSVGEIAYYNGKWYGCTNSATPTYEKFTSS
jgi:hypothetical protein